MSRPSKPLSGVCLKSRTHLITGVILLIAWVSSTIERNQVTYALPKSEARYPGILEDQMDLICRFLGDGTLTFNEACYHSFDQDRRTLIGQKISPFIAAEDNAVLKQQLASLNRENPILTTEFQVMINNGAFRQRWTL